jgi:hypothetical protein
LAEEGIRPGKPFQSFFEIGGEVFVNNFPNTV